MIIKRNNQKKPNNLPIEPVVETEQPIVDNVQTPDPNAVIEEDPKDIFAGFNFDEIDFNQRAERRRGDRRSVRLD